MNINSNLKIIFSSCLILFSILITPTSFANVKINGIKNNLFIGASVGSENDTANINSGYAAVTPQGSVSFPEKATLGANSFSSTIDFGYNFITLNNFTFSPEIYYTYANSKASESSGLNLVGHTFNRSIKFGNQYGFDIKTSYHFDKGNQLYFKTGWGAENISSSYKTKIGGDKPYEQSEYHVTGSKTLQGLLFGVGLSHNINKHLSVFVDWTKFMPKNYDLNKSFPDPRNPGINWKLENNLESISTDNFQVGLTLNF